MIISNRGVVYKGEKFTDHSSCAFPGFCVLPDGRWVCSFRAAPLKKPQDGQHVLITWSDNEGKTWSKPVTPFSDIPYNDKRGLIRGAHMTSLGGKDIIASLFWVDNSSPGLPFFNSDTEGLLDSAVFISRSHDSGESWSKPQMVCMEAYKIPYSLTGPFLIFPDKEIGCQIEINKPYYDTSVWVHSPAIVFSKDDGKTWDRHTVPISDVENRIIYWDQRSAVINGGKTIMSFFWTFNRQSNTYLNIHACESHDVGKTWSEVWDTGIMGQAGYPLQLKDGRLAMLYVDRTTPDTKIKLCISCDMGKTWDCNTELTIHDGHVNRKKTNLGNMDDAWEEMFDFSTGLPSCSLIENGDLALVYYTGANADVTDINWVRVSFSHRK